MPFRTAKYCCYLGVALFLGAGFMFAIGLLATFGFVLVPTPPDPQAREHDQIGMQTALNLVWASIKILSVLGGVAMFFAALYAFAGYGAPYSTGAKSIDAEVESEPKKQK